MIHARVYKGSNKLSKISSVICLPNSEPKGIVYFAHGVTEYAERHAALYEYLAADGYIVIANDHMGHGRSTSKARTYFTGQGDKTGWECAAEDAFRLIQITKEEYPDLPVHGIGFSLGSYLIRFMAIKYHYLFRSVTLIGTGYQGKFTTFIGKLIAKNQCDKFGEKNPSDLVDDMTFNKYNDIFYDYYEYYDDEDAEADYGEDDETTYRALWLLADRNARIEYLEDKRITDGFTTGLFFELLCAMGYTCDEKKIEKLNPRCQILLLSGTDDASGDFTKGVNELEKIYRKCGLRVRKIFYKEARHDILHDFCKEKVFKDIANFLSQQPTT